MFSPYLSQRTFSLYNRPMDNKVQPIDTIQYCVHCTIAPAIYGRYCLYCLALITEIPIEKLERINK